ncbi:Serine/threonine-protein kinase PknB [Novipirellula aureliae]|uniref:Serine/threonine-protein kinase PknB n=1 Tax=Novipirellula aureliae TaxID=2527966 RepID=A0A5C6DAG2_9BACT|nr:serine/threonine protein kinase [Novipirellula aureliae]TWU34143.1 Serine/threonine-protein kinase PknB [Novipirellula aureliae]
MSDQANQQTEFQTQGAQSTSKKLSLESTTPPAKVPGYRLQRFLGAGAFGQVWVGQNLNTGRGVAVKFYLHRGGVNWSLLSREVKNLVQLSADRHVVQVLEVGWDATPPYYVMELIQGGSLEDRLQRVGRLSVTESVAMFREILIGLNHCHGKGVLHCDLKPANILLGEENEPRLADFGQSRMSHDQTPALGTLFYMAPEQADLTSTPDARWDVYAAGAILFRLLTGEPPYRNASLLEQIDTADSLPVRLQHYRTAIQSSEIPTAHSKIKGVDRSLGRIVNRCLEVDPADRYENVQQILQDLDARDRTLAKRPLMLLGIVGPLLVLLATCLFAVRSIEHATESTQSALRTEASSSNQLAAKFAARTLESELERYFDAAQREARSKSFRMLLQQTIEDPSIVPLREIIASADASAAEKESAREQLLDSPVRLELRQQLIERLLHFSATDAAGRRPRFATMFVTDSTGTMIAIAYDKPVERDQNSAGRNFAFRTYFHGGSDDLDESIQIDSIRPLRRTHLSSAFQSTATGLWKVAVSTPIYFTEQRDEPDAVLVATINLGDFQLLQSEEGANQVAVLVEARTGARRGTVLQHPLMDTRREAGETLADEKFQIDGDLVNEILRGGDVNYNDPVATSPDGALYDGEWIVAMQPVELPRNVYDSQSEPSEEPFTADQSIETDLLVMVQYRLAKVMAPVGKMRRDLFSEGALAVLSLLAVTISLWFVVRRISESDLSMHSSEHDAIPESTGNTETIAVK